MSDLALRYQLLRDVLGDDHPATIAAFAARDAEVHAEELAESGGRPALWYLSFVDPDIAAQIPEGEERPGGPSWLGAAIVAGFGIVDASRNAMRLGCNPGGEVAAWGPFPLDSWPASWLNRILTADEATSLPEPSE